MGEAAGTIAGALIEGDAKKRQGEFAYQQAQMNARLMEIQEKDAKQRGSREADQIRDAARQMRGRQRAAIAASGINLEGGSAEDVTNETMIMGELDAQTRLNNAYKEAWGMRQQANQTLFEGAMARETGIWGANATYLTAGARLAGMGVETAASMGGGGKGAGKGAR